MQPPSQVRPDELTVLCQQIERALLAGRRFVHEAEATNTFYQFQQIAHELYHDPEQPEHLHFHCRCVAGHEKMQLWLSGDESVKKLVERLPIDLKKFRLAV